MLEVNYALKNGDMGTFSIDNAATLAFGFVYQDRVKTPRGPASVIGVREKSLYFHVDGDSGATYWSSCNTAEDFQLRGFTTVSEPLPQVDPNEYHRLKTVKVRGQTRQLVMQNINGPCPIIALANALLVSGKLELKEYVNRTAIASERLKAELLLYLQQDHEAPAFDCPVSVDEKKLLHGMVLEFGNTLRSMIVADLSGGKALLSRFYEGLNVTPVFCDIDAFEAEEDCCLFALAGLRVLHGWLVDPNDEAMKPFHAMSYMDLATIATDDSNANHAAAHAFLGSHSSQLTPHGLEQIKAKLAEGEVTVLFRNNHFSTLLKAEGKLLVVVSDEGYTDRRSVVFEELTVDGNGAFFDGDIHPVPAHVLCVLSAYGDAYTEDEIHDAHKAVCGTELEPAYSAEQLAAYIEKKRPAPQTPAAGGSAAASPAGSGATAAPTTSPVTVPLIEGPPEAKAVSQLDAEKIQQLVAMGFTELEATNALESSAGSVERALDILFL